MIASDERPRASPDEELDPSSVAGNSLPRRGAGASAGADTASESLMLALFDAYSIALAGGVREALRRIDAAAVEFTRATGKRPPALTFLAKSRVLLDHEDPAVRRQAWGVLEILGKDGGEIGKLARHELRRHRRSAGRIGDRTLLRLIEFGKRLSGDLEPRELLRLVLHEALELAGCRRGFVALARGRQIEFAVAENVEWSEIADPHRQISHSLVREVLETGRPVILDLGDQVTHAATASLSDLGIRFALCAPIGDLGATLGALYLDRAEGPPETREELPRLLELFCGLAAGAIEQAWVRDRRIRELTAARRALRQQEEAPHRRCRYGCLVGISAPMQQVYRQLDQIIPTEYPVLITGETGTGKEVAARLIHDRGPRKGGRFVGVNCAGVPDTLLEDELFGHERGAFSGAERTRPGVFERAHRGTLFFDEIGEMSPRMQAALLRSLESGEVRRLGGQAPLRLDVRVIAASLRDLDRDVAEGRFRQDLFFRLNVLRLRLPALRERPEDLPLLTAELAGRHSGDGNSLALSERAMRSLMSRPWPGNVRELENLVKRLIALGLTSVDLEDLPTEEPLPNKEMAFVGTLRQLEEAAIRAALQRAGGNRSEAARALGISRRTLYARLRRMER